ncbi:hypothetical protein Dimus_037801 [Dionaea muscipula]
MGGVLYGIRCGWKRGKRPDLPFSSSLGFGPSPLAWVLGCSTLLHLWNSADKMDNQEPYQLEEIVVQQLLNLMRNFYHMMVLIMQATLQLQENNYWLEVDQSPIPYQAQLDHLNRLVNSEVDCHEQLRVSRHTFMVLCTMVRRVGVRDSNYVVVEEKVAMFLQIVGHDKKNRAIKFAFMRSGETVSRYFNEVLKAILSLHDDLYKKPSRCLLTVMTRDGNGFR